MLRYIHNMLYYIPVRLLALIIRLWPDVWITLWTELYPFLITNFKLDVHVWNLVQNVDNLPNRRISKWWVMFFSPNKIHNGQQRILVTWSRESFFSSCPGVENCKILHDNSELFDFSWNFVIVVDRQDKYNFISRLQETIPKKLLKRGAMQQVKSLNMYQKSIHTSSERTT